MDVSYLKKVGLYIAVSLLSLGILFYIGYHIWHSFTREIECEAVGESSAQQTVSFDAYIFKSEEVLNKTTGGQATVPLITDGTKVCPGTVVAEVYSSASPKITEDIFNVKSQIEILENCDKNPDSLKNTAGIDESIYDILGEIRLAGHNGSSSEFDSLGSSLLTLLNRRAIITGDVKDYTAEIASLESEEASLFQSLGTPLEDIYSKSSGYYFSVCDGYETVFSASALNDITYEELSKRLSATPYDYSSTAGKTVTDSTWYLVCDADKKYAKTFKEGENSTVFFSGSYSLTMDVYRIVEGENGVYIIFSTNYWPEDFSFDRMQKVELVTKTYEGYKIPISAVRQLNGVTGVYVLDEVTIRFRKIAVLYKGDSYYIVAPEPEEEEAGEEDGDKDGESEDENEEPEWLKFHDNLIVEGKGLYDGRVVGK